MEINPIEHFNRFLKEELTLTAVRISMACCLSTIGIDNYPSVRFVSQKDIVKVKFIITGTFSSRKGVELETTNKVALTFWWTETERQVRIQGDATIISDQLAVRYFAERSKDTQIVIIISEQGQEVSNMDLLNKRFQ